MWNKIKELQLTVATIDATVTKASLPTSRAFAGAFTSSLAVTIAFSHDDDEQNSFQSVEVLVRKNLNVDLTFLQINCD